MIPGQDVPFKHLVQADWLRENIQDVGPLGKEYPDIAFAMEGDTVSYMACIPVSPTSYHSSDRGIANHFTCV